jgi:hypothetical protein
MSKTYNLLIIPPALLINKNRASTGDNDAMEIDEPTVPVSEADTQQMKDAEAARLAEEVNKNKEEVKALKAEADKLFRDNKWELAATKYGAAIAKDATDPVLYANRAACSLAQSK